MHIFSLIQTRHATNVQWRRWELDDIHEYETVSDACIHSLLACVEKKYCEAHFFRQLRRTQRFLGEITFAQLNRKIFYGARIVYAKSGNIKEIYEDEKGKKHNCQLWVNIKAVNGRLCKWESIFILFYLFFPLEENNGLVLFGFVVGKLCMVYIYGTLKRSVYFLYFVSPLQSDQ